MPSRPRRDTTAAPLAARRQTNRAQCGAARTTIDPWPPRRTQRDRRPAAQRPVAGDETRSRAGGELSRRTRRGDRGDHSRRRWSAVRHADHASGRIVLGTAWRLARRRRARALIGIETAARAAGWRARAPVEGGVDAGRHASLACFSTARERLRHAACGSSQPEARPVAAGRCVAALQSDQHAALLEPDCARSTIELTIDVKPWPVEARLTCRFSHRSGRLR